ncbi:MAG: IS110 family transposase [Dialister invisus]|uniref:IS110 family transposase n=1 Tax=Dialister invisus TaxID=218538 RepID=UPI00399B0ABC
MDSRNIAHLLMTDSSLKPYSLSSYHMEELKSLTRYRASMVRERTKLKTSIARLVTILFPELEQLVSSIHIHSIYAMLEEFPGSAYIAAAHLTRLAALLLKASRGRFGKRNGHQDQGYGKAIYRGSQSCQIDGITAYHSTFTSL